MAHELGKPREEQMRLVAELAAELATVRGLDGLEPTPALERPAGRQHANREVEAVPSVALDRGWSEQSRHVIVGPGAIVPEDARAHTA